MLWPTTCEGGCVTARKQSSKFRSDITNLLSDNTPTAPHAINNSIDTLGWTHTTVGDRCKNSSRYFNWRNEVETLTKGKGWLWKKDAGNQYDAFVLQCVRLDDFPVSGASLIRFTPKTDDTKPAHKAINELMLDCGRSIGSLPAIRHGYDPRPTSIRETNVEPPTGG